MPVMMNSGCVIMDVKGTTVVYYEKCNHCQSSEYNDKSWKETPWQELGIYKIGEYTCKKCKKKSKVELKFYKL
jgi:hypothetical protein